MTRTYDPFAIERPRLKLGEFGEWELGELHDARHARFKEWYAKFEELSAHDDSSLSDFARVVGELIAVSCINADDAPDVLADLCDPEVHGEDARGLQTLQGIVKFIVAYVSGEESAGEG